MAIFTDDPPAWDYHKYLFHTLLSQNRFTKTLENKALLLICKYKTGRN